MPELVETQPELLAHHYTEAGLHECAVAYWQRAGERAVQRSAYQEAISHFTQGLEALRTLPETPERARCELALHLALGVPLQGCDRAIPNPNLFMKSFSYKINHLLTNVVLLYSTGSHANALDAGP